MSPAIWQGLRETAVFTAVAVAAGIVLYVAGNKTAIWFVLAAVLLSGVMRTVILERRYRSSAQEMNKSTQDK